MQTNTLSKFKRKSWTKRQRNVSTHAFGSELYSNLCKCPRVCQATPVESRKQFYRKSGSKTVSNSNLPHSRLVCQFSDAKTLFGEKHTNSTKGRGEEGERKNESVEHRRNRSVWFVQMKGQCDLGEFLAVNGRRSAVERVEALRVSVVCKARGTSGFVGV